MSDVTRFWFRPRQATANTLAAKVVAAGHTHVVIRNGLVGLIPFELSADAFGWVQRMQNHFDADFIESS